MLRVIDLTPRPVLAALLVAAASGAAGAPLAAQTGTFHLYKLQHRVGTETYARTPGAGAGRLDARWGFRYLGDTVSLEAEATVDASGAIVRLRQRGKSSTMTAVDTAAVVAAAGRFALTPYAPFALQEALFQHWKRSGEPERLPLAPAGDARFERAGADTVDGPGGPSVLARYLVSGIVWGKQSAWFDAAGRLVAAISGDAELDRMEAVRDGYERHLARFVARSVADGIADQARVARGLPPAAEGRFALTGARVVDGTGAPPVEGATVLVRDGVVEAVGPARAVPIPAGVRRIDVRGATVLPGLWDTHAHYEQAEWPLVALASGVTTARDAGNEIELATGLRDAIERRTILGPRLLLAGVIDGGPSPLGVVVAATEAEARAAVRRYASLGYRQIKVYQSLPPALVAPVAAEAHRLGLAVTGHVPTGMDLLQFVEAGADMVNHAGAVTRALRTQPRERVVGLLTARGTRVEPTFARGEQHAHSRDSGFVAYEPGVATAPRELRHVLEATGTDAASARRMAPALAESRRTLAELGRAGVPLLVGTDLTVPGHTIYRELELFVEAGYTPMEAIVAATGTAAAAMGLARESGTIAPGMRADLLVVDGDPLSDIRRLRSTRYVVAGGQMWETAGLWRAAGFGP